MFKTLHLPSRSGRHPRRPLQFAAPQRAEMTACLSGPGESHAVDQRSPVLDDAGATGESMMKLADCGADPDHETSLIKTHRQTLKLWTYAGFLAWFGYMAIATLAWLILA